MKNLSFALFFAFLLGAVNCSAGLILGGTNTGDQTDFSMFTGNLPVTNLNGGTNASGTTAWFGDGTWKAVSGGSGTVTSVATSGNITGGPITTTGTLGFDPTSISGTGAITITAGGTNKSVKVAPSGTGGLSIVLAGESDVTLINNTSGQMKLNGGAAKFVSAYFQADIEYQAYPGAKIASSGALTIAGVGGSIQFTNGTSYLNTTDAVLTRGTANRLDILKSGTAGDYGDAKLRNLIATGTLSLTNTNIRGNAVLSSGAVTVSTTAADTLANVTYFLTDCSTSNVGSMSVGTVVAGTSFVINSSNVLESGTVQWEIHAKN